MQPVASLGEAWIVPEAAPRVWRAPRNGGRSKKKDADGLRFRREREQSTSREQSTTLLSLFLLLFLKTTPYLAERVAGDLLRQALVEEGAAVSLFALVEEIGREREA